MSLSKEALSRLELARSQEKTYTPNHEIQRELGSRSLVMVVAPAAMGKTYLMRAIIAQDDRFGMSATVTTRDQRPDDDPLQMRTLERTDQTIDRLLNRVDRGEMVQYAIHPTELTFYGSEIEDHPAQHNLLATLSGSIDQLKHVGFSQTKVIGVVAPPADWRKWFNNRYSITDPKRLNRLGEAEQSYKDLLERDDVTWVVNREGFVEEVARDVIAAVDGTYSNSNEPFAYVQRIRQLIADAKREASYTGDYE